MTKKILFIALLYVAQSFAQDSLNRPFFTGSLNFSLGLNENYVLFEPDDDEYLIDFTGFYFRTGFGYEFQRKFAVSINAGYDYHSRYSVSAIPTYGSLKYNITEREDDAFFVEMSYGKMWRPSNSYPDGNYYGFGIGSQFSGENRWNLILKLDFHRKGIFGFENNRIDSLSFGVGFSFF
ncbi:hypothetical protein KO506_07580 [Polaribacter vadi]|uniref:hypothetical protein n=1 Tax=Polaribacter TaxID=52959 RepID=UPI001C0A3F41|nr:MULTISPECIES: hypothetical protein [Polaribacter]MBU3011258.1 hypothetical protein [Polaribacter vadi]MDO6741071.1 hypothetical protein [Polaribacter sp. 1_MG-2023]